MYLCLVQLLHRLKIRSADGNEMLLKVVKNPMSRHLPAGIRCYGKILAAIFWRYITVHYYQSYFTTGLSHQGTLTTPMKFAESVPAEGPIAFVFGAFAVGKIDPNDHPYVSVI